MNKTAHNSMLIAQSIKNHINPLKMKRIFLVIALIVGLVSCGNVNRQQSTDNSHNHEHSADSHQHSADCSHDHNHDAHNHEAEVHNHDHAHSSQPEAHSHNHDHSVNSQQSTVNSHNHEHSADSHQHSADCSHDHSHDHSVNSQQSTANSHSHNHGEGSINFPIDQQKKIDFEVVEVVTEPLYQVIRTSAQIVPSQDSEKILTATTSGIVTFESKDIVHGLESRTASPMLGLFLRSNRPMRQPRLLKKGIPQHLKRKSQLGQWIGLFVATS